MQNGYYFSLDADAFKEGMIIFRYCMAGIGKQFRIYLTFSNESVRFYLHKLSESNAGTEHFSGCIMSLSISQNSDVRNGLREVLELIPHSNPDYLREAEDWIEKNQSHHYSCMSSYSTNDIHQHSFNQILLLDFVFEMEHGTVFQTDPKFEAIYSALHNDYLFNSIAAKAEYLYSRKLYNATNGILEYSSWVKAERRWCEIIIDARSERMFHESSWFNETIEEMDDLYSNRNGENDCLDEYANKKTAYKELVSETAKMAMNWYMSVYRPDGVLRIRFGSDAKRPILVIPIALSVLAVLAVAYSLAYETIMDNCIWRTIFLLLAIVCGIAIILTYTITLYRKKDNKKDGKKSRRTLFSFEAIPNIVMPRLFASIAAGWMTVGLSDLVAGGVHYYDQYAWASILILLVLLFFIYFSVKKILPYAKTATRWLISGVLLSISMIYSFLIGWCLLEIYSGKSYFFGCNVPQEGPKTLLVFSIISMFVGIFIQMLFHNKSISAVED